MKNKTIKLVSRKLGGEQWLLETGKSGGYSWWEQDSKCKVREEEQVLVFYTTAQRV